MNSEWPKACAICNKDMKGNYIYCVTCLFTELRRLDPEGEHEAVKRRYEQHMRDAAAERMKRAMGEE